MNIDLSQYSFDSLAVNTVVVWIIQQMKSSTSPLFSWISHTTPAITKALSVIMAALTAAGMEVTYTLQNGEGTLVIGHITVTSVLLFAWYIVKNVAFQHVIYKVGFKPSPGEAVKG